MRLADTLSDYWVAFARTGAPVVRDAPEWPRYSPTNDAFLELGASVRSGHGFLQAEVALMDRVVGQAWAGLEDDES
jgi:carboxylesterase type B